MQSLADQSTKAKSATYKCVMLSQMMQKSQLSLRTNTHDSAFAMIPTSFSPTAVKTAKATDNLNFTPSHSDSATTRFVLNNHGAYDNSVASF